MGCLLRAKSRHTGVDCRSDIFITDLVDGNDCKNVSFQHLLRHVKSAEMAGEDQTEQTDCP